MRATNQALGRVIRHKDDFGAVIFADERFAYRNHQNQLSLWLRPAMQTFDTFEKGIESLSAFFERCGHANSALMLAARNRPQRRNAKDRTSNKNNETTAKQINGRKSSNTNIVNNNNTTLEEIPTFVKKSRVLGTSLPSAHERIE